MSSELCRQISGTERMTEEPSKILEYYLKDVPGVRKGKVYDRTCNAIIEYDCSRSDIVEALAAFSFSPYMPSQMNRSQSFANSAALGKKLSVSVQSVM